MGLAQAENGHIGAAFSGFSRDDLKRGFHLEEFRFSGDGSASVKTWIHSPHPAGKSVPTIDRKLHDWAVLTNAEAARGHLGEVTGRLTGPVQFVWKLMGFWRLGMLDVVGILGYDPEDIEHVSAVLGGKEQFRGRDVRERISHLFFIRRALWSLFRDLDVENDWLRERHHMLNEKSPLSLMLEGSMEDFLLAREYVDHASAIR